MLLTKPHEINAFRLLALQKGLKLELKGLKVSRGISCYKIIKEEFPLIAERMVSNMMGTDATVVEH